VSQALAQALELLRQRGADAIDHPGGTLLAHLERVADRLRGYGASADLQLAGLMHAAYSTDGFDTALMTRDERPLLTGIIGPAAETVVYRYAATDRVPFYRQLGQPLVVWTDRFTRSGITLDPVDVAPLVELTVANELDVLAHLGVTPNDALRDLLTRARPAMSAGAWADVTRLL
jgi:hypothetical protein